MDGEVLACSLLLPADAWRTYVDAKLAGQEMPLTPSQHAPLPLRPPPPSPPAVGHRWTFQASAGRPRPTPTRVEVRWTVALCTQYPIGFHGWGFVGRPSANRTLCRSHRTDPLAPPFPASGSSADPRLPSTHLPAQIPSTYPARTSTPPPRPHPVLSFSLDSAQPPAHRTRRCRLFHTLTPTSTLQRALPLRNPSP